MDGTAPTNTPVVVPTETAVPSQFTFEKRINRSWDDVEERVSDGVIYEDSSDLELGDDPATLGNQIIGLRFRNVQVPAGATIPRAYLEFAVDETNSGATNVTIWGQYRGSAQKFDTDLYDVSSWTKTAVSANWSIPAWNSVDSTQQSVDLTAVVSEIISHPNWASGKKMAFIIEGSGTCTAESYDGDSAKAPLLHIEYNLGGSSPTATATALLPTATFLPNSTATPTPTPPPQ